MDKFYIGLHCLFVYQSISKTNVDKNVSPQTKQKILPKKEKISPIVIEAL